MMNQPPQTRDEQGSDHDLLIRLKENLIYFQDHVIGEIRDAEKRSEEKFAKANGELCVQSKRIGECEKDIIRKQGQCDTIAQSTGNIKSMFDAYVVSNAKAFDALKEETKAKIESMNEQHRKDMATAITLTSIVIGLITFLVGKFVV